MRGRINKKEENNVSATRILERMNVTNNERRIKWWTGGYHLENEYSTTRVTITSMNGSTIKKIKKNQIEELIKHKCYSIKNVQNRTHRQFSATSAQSATAWCAEEYWPSQILLISSPILIQRDTTWYRCYGEKEMK